MSSLVKIGGLVQHGDNPEPYSMKKNFLIAFGLEKDTDNKLIVTGLKKAAAYNCVAAIFAAIASICSIILFWI